MASFTIRDQLGEEQQQAGDDAGAQVDASTPPRNLRRRTDAPSQCICCVVARIQRHALRRVRVSWVPPSIASTVPSTSVGQSPRRAPRDLLLPSFACNGSDSDGGGAVEQVMPLSHRPPATRVARGSEAARDRRVAESRPGAGGGAVRRCGQRPRRELVAGSLSQRVA